MYIDNHTQTHNTRTIRVVLPRGPVLSIPPPEESEIRTDRTPFNDVLTPTKIRSDRGDDPVSSCRDK